MFFFESLEHKQRKERMEKESFVNAERLNEKRMSTAREVAHKLTDTLPVVKKDHKFLGEHFLSSSGSDDEYVEYPKEIRDLLSKPALSEDFDFNEYRLRHTLTPEEYDVKEYT